MPALSYREYLDILQGPPAAKRIKHSVYLAAFAILFLVTGTAGSLFYYYNKNILPRQTALNYIQEAAAGFNSQQQSLNDILETFQVAGAKVSIVDSLKNSSNPQSGYFIDLAQKQNLLEKLDLSQKNVAFQKSQLEKSSVPLGLENINTGLIDYYRQSETVLTQTQKDHEFFKDVLLALGPDFYLPSLTDTTIWQSNDPRTILNYYQDKKLKAQVALSNFSKLQPDADFKDYYNNELSYIELYIQTATKIADILNSQTETAPDSANQVEQAYQVLINAQKQNDSLSQKLLNEKESLLELKENLGRFAPLRYEGNSLESQINEIVAAKQQNNSPLFLLPGIVQTYFHTN